MSSILETEIKVTYADLKALYELAQSTNAATSIRNSRAMRRIHESLRKANIVSKEANTPNPITEKEMELDMVKSELKDVKASAMRIAGAFRDLNNDYGNIPEIHAAFESVYSDILSNS